MNKKDIIDELANETAITKKDASTMVNAMFDIMTNGLLNEDKVVVTGFGTFMIHKRNQRRVISPNDHEEMIIPACKTVLFKPSHIIKDKINDH
jgi:nucleoid DNA-binding protein